MARNGSAKGAFRSEQDVFFVIYEAPADFATATELADRVLVEQIDWLDDTLLDSQRQWVGEEPQGSRLAWKSIRSRAHALGIRAHGHFEGEPGLPDAAAARRAIRLARHLIGDVEAILLIRDADNQIERRKGLEQATATDTSQCTIVIGLAICERECWIISGFDPKDQNESERLKLEIQNLGWNPCLASHNLAAGKNASALKSPKRVLAALTNSDWDRQRECWVSTPLGVLRERGRENGLTDYLGEVQTHLVSLTTGYEAEP